MKPHTRFQHKVAAVNERLSLIDFRVMQSRGLCNSNTPYHDRIIRLVESNANLFRRQMGA